MKQKFLLPATWLLATAIAANVYPDEGPLSGQAIAAGPQQIPAVAKAEPAALPAAQESFRVGDDVYVRSLAVDSATGSLWVGTSTGVLEIDLDSRELRNTYTRDDGLANEYVFAIFVDSRGHKWFGTNAGGVSRLRGNDWDVYFPMHGLADYWIYSFAEQAEGPLWVGTWAGVNSIDLDTMQFRTYVRELVNEWVYAIDTDSRDRVWFGTEGGVSLFDGRSWQHWTHDDGLGAPNTGQLPASANTGLGTRTRHDLSILLQGRETYNPNYVFSLLVDPQDHVWVGTWGGGVARYDGTRWTNYTSRDGLAGNIVYSIARSEDGALWFGTNHGLTRYDGSNWNTYNTANALLGNDVYAIAITPGNEVWAGTRRGVTRIGGQVTEP